MFLGSENYLLIAYPANITSNNIFFFWLHVNKKDTKVSLKKTPISYCVCVRELIATFYNIETENNTRGLVRAGLT